MDDANIVLLEEVKTARKTLASMQIDEIEVDKEVIKSIADMLANALITVTDANDRDQMYLGLELGFNVSRKIMKELDDEEEEQT